MPSNGPTFEIVGDLSDEAIEALARLLLAIADEEEADSVEVCQEPSSKVTVNE